MIVRNYATQYHIIIITNKTLPAENDIVSKVLYDNSQLRNTLLHYYDNKQSVNN
jgi:hypothetical protein